MAKRDISPILQMVRNFLLGREHITALRFQADIATRSPPLPALPDGPHHKLSANYYYTRDGRRESTPPILVAGGVKSIPAPADAAPKAIAAASRTPGPMFQWD